MEKQPRRTLQRGRLLQLACCNASLLPRLQYAGAPRSRTARRARVRQLGWHGSRLDTGLLKKVCSQSLRIFLKANIIATPHLAAGSSNDLLSAKLTTQAPPVFPWADDAPRSRARGIRRGSKTANTHPVSQRLCCAHPNVSNSLSYPKAHFI